ncbi:hypothetical protein [Flagellimonas sp.]|uniref:hypothetical protein n=1 Tax=Flagellimonas sp. TaxID=2058762 RepID=UPI003BACC1DE
MSKNYIKYPIAFHKQSEKLIGISDVTDENKTELICLECKENFVAVRKHQTPHFKHKPNSKCKGNVETYIHWITKEVFKEIKEIELPEIFIHNLTENQREKFNNQVNLLIKHNVPENLQIKFRKNLKKNISESGIFQIEKIETEKEYKTTIGNVRIDIVITINNQEVFIEPFFSNQIDDFKRRKLILLERPTLAIDLLTFIDRFDYQYNLENLKDYLISKKGKNWISNRERKIEKYRLEYINYVSEEIKRQHNDFKLNNLKLKKITELESEINVLEKKIRPTKDKIWKLKHEISEIKNELGIRDYEF